jgi:uncharacterized membrane protein (DUF106 family)
MGALLRTIGVSIVTMVAGYAMKKLMSSLEKQAEAAKQQAENASQPQNPKELKTLKQDPVTGVYYAED